MAWLSNEGFSGKIDITINPTTGVYSNTNITAGPGIKVSGNTVTNDGIRSIIAGGGLQLGGDVAHNPTISLTAAATGVEQCLPGTGISITGDPALPLITNTGVLSVTGTGVDNTDPQNPVLTVVESLTAGTNVIITGTASNPIISASGGGGGGPTSDLFTIVEQDVTFSDLASAAVVSLFSAAVGVDYLIAAIQIDESLSTNFSGGGGDRGLEFVGGGSTVGQLTDTNMQNIAGVFDEIPGQVPVSFSVSYLGLRNIGKGGTVYCSYTGGTTDYTAGSLRVKIYLLNTNATAIGGGDSIVYVKDVSITAAGLASGGQVTILNNTDPAGQYEIIAAYASNGAVDFDNGSTADIVITDGTHRYFAATALDFLYYASGASASLGALSTNLLLQTNDPIWNPSVAGADIYAFTDGSPDYVTGEFKLSMVLRKIAGNNSVGVQQVVAGAGVAVDNTNPQYPVVSSQNPLKSMTFTFTAADLAGSDVTPVLLFTVPSNKIYVGVSLNFISANLVDFDAGGDRELSSELSFALNSTQLKSATSFNKNNYLTVPDAINSTDSAYIYYTAGATDYVSGTISFKYLYIEVTIP